MGEPDMKSMLVTLTTEQLRELADIIRSEPRPAEVVAAEEWMDTDNAAKWLGIHVQTLLAAIAADNPPWAKRFGRTIRVSRTLLMQAPPVERPKRKLKR